LNKLVAQLILGALVLAACAQGPIAATVDGTVITVDDVEALMAGESVVDRPTFSQFLGAAIQLQILFTAAKADYGIDPSEEEVTAEADSIFSRNAVEGQTRQEFLEQAGISELLLQDLARQQLIDQGVRAELGSDVETNLEPTQEQVDAARRQAEWSIAEVCAAHILVNTEEEALAVLDRFDAGEDFAELATELSTDTGSGENGGDLGCSPPARYVEAFAEATMSAELGIPTEPVMSQFGYHVILVSERTDADPDQLPSEEEITAQARQGLIDEAGNALTEAVNQWASGAFTAAEVVVEEEYGSWDPLTARVTPPA
jgi:parvulin-like peptidyl-prolyl isomerase